MAMSRNRERTNSRAVIYSRLSPRIRPDGSESCEKQIEICQRYCDFCKLEVIGVFSDKNKSGAKAADRPGLQLALHKTIKNQAILVVHSLSRLAWNTKETIKIIERLEHAKANLCSFSEKIDTTKDHSRYFYKMVALFVKLERELVSERTSEAMLRHQRARRRMSFLPPYGMKKDPKDPTKLKINFDEQRAIIGSLPCYTPVNVDKQRGEGVFEKSVKALKLLNKLSYGSDKGPKLNLVYNPGGDFLPGPQEQLEADYKRELNNKYGVMFNNLFTIINAPIGRFRQYLEANGRLKQYLQMLAENFNTEAAENIMCRNLVSIDYRGMLCNCDFNQALGLPIIDAAGNNLSIEKLDDILSEGIEIITGEHCFCCTAGAGSSCTGSLVK